MMAEDEPDNPFLSERRAVGLLGAAVIATVAYGLVTGINVLEGVIFFVIFAVVFTVLNYALWRYD